MARPQSEEYDARKERILDTSARIFADAGFHGASINQIARACHISKSLIYHYYPSKQAILYHAMIDYVTLLREVAKKRMQARGTAEEKLTAIVTDFLEIYEHSASRHIVLLNELDSLTDTEKQEVITLQDDVVHIFADLADAISPAPLGEYRAKSAIAMLLMGMINWTYTWFKPGGAVDRDALPRIIMTLFLNGLKQLDTAALTPADGDTA
ncbi:TetR/AcrR family transcriptional regulator [Yunchengibacter salinarum]|uniref:TetR/AcrR family transcriptional regulator n=1 Tax=Yunchengibacter salinarum TaxID=3133399 RepID=UPI0035B68BC8